MARSMFQLRSGVVNRCEGKGDFGGGGGYSSTLTYYTYWWKCVKDQPSHKFPQNLFNYVATTIAYSLWVFLVTFSSHTPSRRAFWQLTAIKLWSDFCLVSWFRPVSSLLMIKHVILLLSFTMEGKQNWVYFFNGNNVLLCQQIK